MPLVRLWRRWFGGSLGSAISEERDHADSLERLDLERPGWDRDGRLAACETGLRNGIDRAALLGIYGEDVVREAEERLGRPS